MFFFFNDPATTEISTLSLHDALPIWAKASADPAASCSLRQVLSCPVLKPSSVATSDSPRPSSSSRFTACALDRKSTRLNSSHANISYAVFCLKKKNNFPTYILQSYKQ